jgi:hypothetical protein
VKRNGSLLLGAGALLVLAAVSWFVHALERDLAEAQRRFATLDYPGVVETLDRAERYYEFASRVPWVGMGTVHDIRARKAALSYWQRDYGGIVPAVADPMIALPPENTALQFIVANAVYRMERAQVKDQRTLLQALDAGIGAQLVVLRNSQRNEDAAYNYEYLIRARAAVIARPGQPRQGEDGTEKSTHGQPGGAPRDSEESDFKIHIPLESKEFQDQKEGEQAGKTVTRQRRG